MRHSESAIQKKPISMLCSILFRMKFPSWQLREPSFWEIEFFHSHQTPLYGSYFVSPLVDDGSGRKGQIETEPWLLVEDWAHLLCLRPYFEKLQRPFMKRKFFESRFLIKKGVFGMFTSGLLLSPPKIVPLPTSKVNPEI